MSAISVAPGSRDEAVGLERVEDPHQVARVHAELAGEIALIELARPIYHTAAALARLGTSVVVTGRDERRGRSAVADLRASALNDDVHIAQAEHATIAGNRELADWIGTRDPALDVLVNNVGAAAPATRTETSDGHELTLALNFLGPFALTQALRPLLRKSPEARVVNVVSSAFAMWKGDPFAEVESSEEYVGIKAYAHAKLLNLLWTGALARRVVRDGSGQHDQPGHRVDAGDTGSTPGVVPQWRLVWPLVRLLQRRASAEAAARRPVFLATATEAGGVTGRYFDEKLRLMDLACPSEQEERAWSLARGSSAQNDGTPSRRGRRGSSPRSSEALPSRRHHTTARSSPC